MRFVSRQLEKTIQKNIQQRFSLYTIVLMVVILGLGYITLLSPKVAEVRRVGSFDLVQTDERVRLKEEVLRVTKSIVQKYDALQAEKFEKLAKVLPSSQDVPSLFVQMEALAASSGLALNSVSFANLGDSEPQRGIVQKAPGEAADGSSQQSPRGLKQLSITMNVSGSDGYENLKRFLSNLESHIRLLELQSFTYSPVSDQEAYQIIAKTYYLE